MRKLLSILAVGALVAACADQGPVAMESNDAEAQRGANGGAVAASAATGAFGNVAGAPFDFRTAGNWEDVGGGAYAQAGGVQGTGAGTFPSFLLFGTAQGRNDGKGYNTDASGGQNRQYEISGGSNTRSVPLNSIPTIARDGEIFREFRFDGQAPGAQSKQDYSVDDIRIFLVPNVAPNNALTSFLESGVVGPRPGVNLPDGGVLVWDMNDGVPTGNAAPTGFRWLWISSALSSGQGGSDLRLMVPNALFMSRIPTEDWGACAFDGYNYAASGSTTSLGSDCPWAILFVSAHGYASPKESGNSEWSVAFRPTLLVTKTAQGMWDESYEWTLSKSADATDFDMFRGDVAEVNYTVTATKDDEPSIANARVEGVITIRNVSSQSVTITGIQDILELNGTGGTFEFDDLECEGIGSLPYVMAGGTTRTCSYALPVDVSNAAELEAIMEEGGVNNVIVTADDPVDAADDGSLAFAGFAPVTWADGPENTVNGTVSVKDVLGLETVNIDETISASDSWEYEHTFTCDADEGKHRNTVTLTGDDGYQKTDAVEVEIRCHALDVSKTAQTHYTRTFDWDIGKTAYDEYGEEISELGPLMPGMPGVAEYAVSVFTTGSTDADWEVSGLITVSNPAPIAAVLAGVSDVVSPDIAASVDCGEDVTFPYTLDAAGDEPTELTCAYQADLPNADARTNTATATLANQHWSWVPGEGDDEGSVEPSPLMDEGEPVTTDFTGTADVTFGNPEMIDACVDVADLFGDGLEDEARELGTACVPTEGEGAYTAGSEIFTYLVQFGGEEALEGVDVHFPELECDENVFSNTASFLTNDLELTGDAGHELTVTVNCAVGCTLTLGYWMTHNQWHRDQQGDRGPPRNDTWDYVGLGIGGVTGQAEFTPFFGQDFGWAEGMRDAPDNSSDYYQAIRRWVAAYLNIVAIARVEAHAEGGEDAFDADPEYWFGVAWDKLDPSVQDAFTAGLAFFEGYGPESWEEAEVDPRSWMGTLNAFNEGDMGFPHCDDL